MTEENDIQNTDYPEIDIEEIKETIESIKIKPDIPEPPSKRIIDEDIKLKKEKKVKIEGEEDVDKTKELFDEFSSFLETKAEIFSDSGIKNTISTGIDLLDAILGGGFAIGALNIIVGQPGSGKSMLAIQVLGQGQRQFGGQLLGGFLDSEEATTTLRLANLGVRYPKLKPYADITVEKVFKFLEGLSLFKKQKGIVDIPSVVVWDSIANTLSQKERETDDINSVIGYKARLLSILIPRYVAKCAQYNICFIAVNQLRDVLNLGMYAPARDLKFMSSDKNMPGGNILKFNAFHLLEMKVKSAIAGQEAEKYGFEGIITKVKCVKNKLFQPNIEIDLVGSFNTGFSNFWTNYNFLKETKRMNTGAWNNLVTLPNKKFRTKDAPNLYQTDEEFKEEYDKNVKEAIQIDIIDKYNPELF